MKSTLLIAGVGANANLENDFAKMESLVKDVKSHVSDQERILTTSNDFRFLSRVIFSSIFGGLAKWPYLPIRGLSEISDESTNYHRAH